MDVLHTPYISMKDEWEFITSYLYDCLEIGDLSTLCGDRVVQMTKTYNDIDAVTKLLEEKEKDLELAAKIGQSLLQQNKQLEGRIEMIEENLTVISDQNTQYRHDIKLKDELLRIYTNDVSQSDSEDETSWSEKSKVSIQTKYINIDTLQKKIKYLEEENLHLRIETAELRTSTTNIEEKEEELVRDCFKQLGEARATVEILTDELSKKFEENMKQQEEITYFLAQIVDLGQKVKKLSVENEEMSRHLRASKEAQQELVKELIEMREKYDEVYTMLQEAQETVKRSNRNALPHGGIGFGTYLNPLPVFPADSLAAELVDSVELRLEKDPHLSKKGKREYNKNVMKTVKVVNKRSHNSPGSGYSSDFYSRPVSPSSSVVSLVGSPRSDMYEGDSESINSSSGIQPQISSIPGSNDLATALRRLNLRRENEMVEKEYAERHMDRDTCPTPDSLLSGLSGISGMSTVPAGGSGGQSFRHYMPEKLQIVKPMEGSMALHHWQRLATPHIASMLDSRPGVMVKGYREIDTKRDSYNLDEIEDDGVVMKGTYPSKGFVNTSSTYTYTTSRLGQSGNTFMSTSNPAGTRMTIDLQHDGGPGVYDPPPGASLGLASVLATPLVTSGSAVRLKASQTGAVSSRSKRSSIGLNMLSTSPSSEKKAELDVDAPSGVHKVSGEIFSRHASPMSSISSGIKILDPDTKARLMEKVKSIRAEKAAEKAAKRASFHRQMSATTDALVLAPSLAVSIPRSTVSLGGMMMSSSTSSTPRMSTYGNGSVYGGAMPSTSMSMSSGAPPGFSLGATTNLSSGATTYLSSSTPTGAPAAFPSGATTYLSSSATSYLSSSTPTGAPAAFRSGATTYLSSSATSYLSSSNPTGTPSAFPSGATTYLSSSATPYLSSSTPTGAPAAFRSGATTNLAPSGTSYLSSSATNYLSSSGSTRSSTIPFAGGLMSPGSTFPPVLGQSRMLASPMSVLAASRPITATTTTCDTTMAGLGEALCATGLGEVLDLMDSPKAKTIISKTKVKSGTKKT